MVDGVLSQDALKVENISVRFGGILALDDVTFDVRRGDICALIGPNGAGKSTLFNCISGMYTANAGRISFEGHELFRMPTRSRAGIGIGRTFQNLALFPTMTVMENILVGTHSTRQGGVVGMALRLPSAQRAEVAAREHAEQLIEFLDLHEVAERPVGDLPFGIQKRVELGRALAGNPRLLLLDEPACGLNHDELHRLGALIRQIRDALQVTTLLVEHHMGLVMDISDHVVALNFGKKICEGTPDRVARDAQVIAAYLGTE